MQNDNLSSAKVSSAEEVTAEWLTPVLNRNGYDCRITQVSPARIGTGQMGENVRFALTGEGEHPATVVGKFMSADPVSRETGKAGMTYAREVHFYRHLRSRVSIATPKPLFVDMDDETQAFILLMEDLAPGEQGDQIKGGSIALAEIALKQVAHLHGPCWQADDLEHADIIARNNTEQTLENMQFLWEMVQGSFLERYASRLTDEESTLVIKMGQSFSGYLLHSYPTTLIHGDYRLDNMLIGGPHPLTTVDWQTLAVGCALQDVAYYMGTSLLPEDRRASEKKLLGLWHKEMQGYGVDIDPDDCWQWYRHFAPAGLVMAVIASVIVGETERGNDMFMAMAKRSAEMCRDLNTFDLLASK